MFRAVLRGGILLATVVAFSGGAQAEEAEEDGYDPAELKRLPLEQLLDVEITSVSRRAEPLLGAASAIGVISNEDIRRSGANNLPDALRLATGLHVAQFDGHSWGISSRGFNTTTANKMQVFMDGRSLYTPLYAGIFWDVQNTFLPDLEQIEVIRGPGATLWGANAMNGVINIRSKSARDTQGWLIHGGAGNIETGFGGVRYGGKVGDTYYRVYATTLNRDHLTQENLGIDARDEYGQTQTGFRIDSELGPDDELTLQGDIYTGRFGQVAADDIEVDGGNVLGRWTRTLSPDSDIVVQAYYDHTHRLIPGSFEEDRNTVDLEFQHSFTWNERHDIIWGLNARLSRDQIGNIGRTLAFLPDRETLYLFSGFIQDEIHLIPKLLSVTIGTKLEHNSFSGFEIQPSVRFALTPTSKQTLWGAVSRSVRTPSRVDQDVYLPNPAVAPSTFQTNREFDSEELIAYELGYRARPASNVTTDLSLFYHDYAKLRSQEPIGAGAIPAGFGNLYEGETYGAELEVKWQPARWWQFEFGYTLMDVNLRPLPASRDVSRGTAEGNDPNNVLVVSSYWDLPGDFEFNATYRYVSELPRPQTPGYSTLDLRLGWEPSPGLELAIVGRNLFDQRHPEYRSNTVSREVGRSVFFTVTCRF